MHTVQTTTAPAEQLINWYIQKINKKSEKERKFFIETLQGAPEVADEIILGNLHNDAMSAQKDLNRAFYIEYSPSFARKIATGILLVMFPKN